MAHPRTSEVVLPSDVSQVRAWEGAGNSTNSRRFEAEQECITGDCHQTKLRLLVSLSLPAGNQQTGPSPQKRTQAASTQLPGLNCTPSHQQSRLSPQKCTQAASTRLPPGLNCTPSNEQSRLSPQNRTQAASTQLPGLNCTLSHHVGTTPRYSPEGTGACHCRHSSGLNSRHCLRHAYIVMTYIVVAYIVTAFIFMAYVVATLVTWQHSDICMERELRVLAVQLAVVSIGNIFRQVPRRLLAPIASGPIVLGKIRICLSMMIDMTPEPIMLHDGLSCTPAYSRFTPLKRFGLHSQAHWSPVALLKCLACLRRRQHLGTLCACVHAPACVRAPVHSLRRLSLEKQTAQC